ncbi:MAG: PEP-CTERM sorting domain-containing protein, partial [Verrucomicrobiota bacterium]
LSLNDFGSFTEGTGFTYDIATYTDTNGPLTSTFAGLANGSQINGSTGQYIITYGNQNGFGGNDYSIRLTAVPEPTTFLLLAPLLFAGFWMMRRRRAANRETVEA